MSSGDSSNEVRTFSRTSFESAVPVRSRRRRRGQDEIHGAGRWQVEVVVADPDTISLPVIRYVVAIVIGPFPPPRFRRLTLRDVAHIVEARDTIGDSDLFTLVVRTPTVCVGVGRRPAAVSERIG